MLGRRLNPQERPPTKDENRGDAAEALEVMPAPSKHWQEALDTLAARRYALPTLPPPDRRPPTP